MSSAPWSCVLWDVDGTIADASAGIIPRIAEVLGELGLPPVPADQVRRWIGPPMLESFQHLAGLAPDAARAAVARYRALAARDGYASSVRVYEGVADVVRAVNAAGIPQATASTKPENQVEAILRHHELDGCFAAIHGASPDPDSLDTKAVVLGRALADLAARGLDISRPVLVGDRHHDVDGAAEHGVPLLFVRWGFGSSQEEAGSLVAVDTPAQLLTRLLGA